MKLLVTRRMTPAAEASISARFDAAFRDSVVPLTLEEATAALADYDMIMPTLGDAFRAEAFGAAIPRTRILANFGAGYNHIDLDAARKTGVVVSNTPDVVTDATAELAVTLLLMTARRAAEGNRLARSGEWTGWHPTQMLGSLVTGKTVGIIGMGRIGRSIARRLHLGFDMRVVFFNRSAVSSLDIRAHQLPSIEEVMEQSDFVIIAVPGGADTHHLIGKSALDRLGSDGVLINIARGDIIDEAALVEALSAGRIRAAGLDVFENEPQISPGLREMDNAVILPHLGTAVEETRTAMARRALENLVAFEEGRAVPDRVD
ncbi:2-hydroxyacid dehydrogenase [Paracoccus aerodenitrificans]|uniref:2-hydroxyacid dehydrogenase n=1 Tax=Paracoccus aerodenitrificans TaxID=3017781 RepID=UPI0022F0EEEB|nr:D-glycerate dehydrogenase [Paracoccus aerodenitrificans]WBU63417.1 D-glycerate dehydrogenase [Paracoccus aerodenitrificans]